MEAMENDEVWCAGVWMRSQLYEEEQRPPALQQFSQLRAHDFNSSRHCAYGAFLPNYLLL